MTLQDIGSIGELVGAIATVAYLAIQIRQNSRGLAANTQPYLLAIANTPGFEEWWRRHSDAGSDVGFSRWVESITKTKVGTESPEGD
jgi:hypothetical protein